MTTKLPVSSEFPGCRRPFRFRKKHSVSGYDSNGLARGFHPLPEMLFLFIPLLII